MKCLECGHTNVETTEICSECGANLSVAPDKVDMNLVEADQTAIPDLAVLLQRGKQQGTIKPQDAGSTVVA